MPPSRHSSPLTPRRSRRSRRCFGLFSGGRAGSSPNRSPSDTRRCRRADESDAGPRVGFAVGRNDRRDGRSRMSRNLLVNPGAELGDASLSGYGSVTVLGWTVTGTPTVIEYGTLRRLPWPLPNPGHSAGVSRGFPTANSAPPGSGEQYFGGGPVATSTLSQTVDLSAAAADIDAGTVPYTLSGSLGGFILDPSAASVRVDFLDENQLFLGSAQLRPVTLLDRGLLQTELLQREASGTIPVGTRSARVVVTFTDRNPATGNYNNAYADDLSFTVGAALPARRCPPHRCRPSARSITCSWFTWRTRVTETLSTARMRRTSTASSMPTDPRRITTR